MKEDPDFEYIAQPNQHRFRFRNNVNYNSKSMRSDEVDTKANIILGFGDSIINGGVQTDQDSLATTILSDTLSKIADKKVQFLNISAGSWGPDNCYAYLTKNGNFGAKSIFLFVSSHDAYDNMNFEKIVGINESFPNKQYQFAVVELFDRYIIPRIKKAFRQNLAFQDNLGINKKKEYSTFNSGFQSFLIYSKSNNIPLTLFLHAELAEVKARHYNEQGKEIIQFAHQNNIPIILDLERGLDVEDFRDDIHVNANGQKKIASAVLYYMKNSTSGKKRI
ncbi:hypothetical protein I5M07_03065 [Flavobacterium sp. SE-1-e]|uniref:SGNH hydrolase-type esterase domain-containing protein n=2 Tax=Flavobacterium agrisoli TaxID=2793066 RepID=A0A934UIQ6_9FLAO|nr:hypothetical protein [Flavobacterium agrisoli]